ncbi:universal stress protein [Candidatus Parabeggiatoa sp. HSG14]|uniref:universal stress protein n=1 Tax=Candidatus Parabeggiatoa sp. HSG14 TaxID=3055593 RepID=UPI0025A7D024|nr:universal stress protein [Thiotrichales bacterium HSG14]
MNSQATIKPENLSPNYQSILIATDSSDHSNRAISDTVSIAPLYNAKITGVHVYAAKLHDVRFRQMEGGLPEQFRQEQELERQRDVHDDLITRGLSIITDSYLDQIEKRCQQESIPFTRRSLEGKNYRELVKEANNNRYELLVLGARGVGAIAGSRLGTVCERVVRRTNIDTLVIKDPQHSLTEGPIVVAVDGSSQSYGGLLTALSFASHWHVPVTVVAAFDPYYHYVAFNRIAGVLSEEASQVFKFKEQEKLHEEIIDSGLAKIYQGHLSIAESIATDYDMKVETVLLDGKPYDAIEKYCRKFNPSLLIIGKIGIHADPELDIGGNAENLLRNVDCAVLLSQRQYQPRLDVVADATTSWTVDAEKRMERVPSFVRNMARVAILRYAQEQGHTVITESIVEEATAQLMPGYARKAMGEIIAAHDAGKLKPSEDMQWSDEANALLMTIEEPSQRDNVSKRAEKKARQEKSTQVEKQHIIPFLEKTPTENNKHWQAAALARLMRVPEGFMRDKSREQIENYAREQDIAEITLEIVEHGLALSRKKMKASMQQNKHQPMDKPGATNNSILCAKHGDFGN